MTEPSELILIVDDDEDMSEFVKFTCKEMGLATVLVENTGKAKKWLDKNVPNLVILDIMMPDGNGLDLLRWIRERDVLKNVPVMVTSGLKDDETVNDALELGAVDFLRKPYGMKLLKEKITRFKARQQAS